MFDNLLLQSEKNEKYNPIDMSSNKDIVVFIVRRNTQCSNCNEELGSGSFIYLENRQPLCLSCADLDHLDYLPSGNAALTRRATKHSRIHAVVVQWSRTRKRYELQSIILAVEAHIRHTYTNYDDLFLRGWERNYARTEVRDEVKRVLNRWREKDSNK